ncbi:MAG: hypothetical protein JWO60_2569, partial [Frankiales bacterium]|nr:hypothetical protein [Frankiales bacterium]
MTRAAAALLALLVPAAAVCAAPAASGGAAPTPARTPLATTALATTALVGTSAPSALPCPSGYAAPDPARPVLTADLTVDGRGGVTGTLRYLFTPDVATGEIVLRLWGAAPRPRARGGSVTVSRVAVAGVPRTVQRPAPTLLRVPLNGRTPAGRQVTVDVAFSLRLPVGADDRLGFRSGVSWLGSGVPLLAWERGRGWATEPETRNFAEATTSEAMELRRLAVTRPAGQTVLATGARVSDDGRTAVFRARAVRDLLVASGAFRVSRTTASTGGGGVPVEVGVAPGLRDDPAAVAAELSRAVRAHASRFGPYPYERLVAAVVPDLSGGVEQPGAVLLGSGQGSPRDATGSHEVAHLWWYGLVGDDQARDPWLDEAFATYAEALDRGTGPGYERTTVPADALRRTGAPMTYWEGRSSYYRGVYVQGATALLRARRA